VLNEIEDNHGSSATTAATRLREPRRVQRHNRRDLWDVAGPRPGLARREADGLEALRDLRKEGIHTLV